MVIRREGGKYVLRTRDGKRVLGRHDTKQEAIAQERAIKHTQRQRGSQGKPTRNKR